MRMLTQGLTSCYHAYRNVDILPLSFPKVDEQKKSNIRSCLQTLMEESDMQIAISTFLQDDSLFDLSWMSETDRQQFYELSKQFVTDAQEFDETLTHEEIFQALRNIWIIWMLQMLFQKPLQYHRAMFGYSMLYPYSDNLLDQVDLSFEEKQVFNACFTKRLHGEVISCEEPLLQKIDALVACIEQVYDRQQYPDVYESLYLIQEAQIKSLQQHQTQDEDELLAISIEKGGTSVIADGYLIDGTLNDEQFQFCINFGFGLQISDDLQDEVEDEHQGHHTLATICKNENERWFLFRHCWFFIQETMTQCTCAPAIKTFVTQSCLQLLSGCIMQHPERYPDKYHEQLKEILPVEQEELEQINQSMKEKMEAYLVD